MSAQLFRGEQAEINTNTAVRKAGRRGCDTEESADICIERAAFRGSLLIWASALKVHQVSRHEGGSPCWMVLGSYPSFALPLKTFFFSLFICSVVIIDSAAGVIRSRSRPGVVPDTAADTEICKEMSARNRHRVVDRNAPLAVMSLVEDRLCQGRMAVSSFAICTEVCALREIVDVTPLQHHCPISVATSSAP